MQTKSQRSCLLALIGALIILSLSRSEAQPVQINEEDRVTLMGNVHDALANASSRFAGRTDPNESVNHMIMVLNVPPGNQEKLDALLEEQQDPTSPNFHHWLTPQQFGDQFGPSDSDIAVATGWLKKQGFTVDHVAAGKWSVNFSGNAAKVEKAFRTTMMNVQIKGQGYRANVTDPSIPKALSGVVHGVVALHNIPRRSHHTDARPLMKVGKGNGMTPGDFATIYNVKPLYSAGINGTGVTIGLCEQNHVAVTDIHNFRSRFKLPTNDPVFVFNGPDPGIGPDDGEADPDTEWAGAVAKNATVKFCVADNVDLSAQYLVDNNLADVISTSFGDCEQTMGTTGDQFYKNLWAQASAQGITVFAAAGDSGAAECDAGAEGRGIGQGALGTASTVYNIAVGGTEFNEGTNNSLYWNSTTNADGSSAKGYIPEMVWNESSLMPGGLDIWAGAGGPSALYAKPAWQAAPGMPLDGWRDTPDISLAAAGFHDGFVIISGGVLQTIGGTSLSSPAYASIMALIVQKTGQRQGNCNPNFYRLARNQYLNLGPVIFHDITVGHNNVRETAGYNAAPGYDMASGLGSVDVTALVNNWGASTNVGANITVPDVNLAVLNGTTLSFSGTATDNVPQNLNYVWRLGDGSVATGTNATHLFSNPGVKNLAQTVTITATDGSGNYGSFSRNVTVGADLYAPRQLLLNTSFEAQDLNWVLNGFFTGPFADLDEPARSGINIALANSSDTITMYQQVTIPSTYNQATLSYWLHINTLATTTTAQDTMKVQIRNSSGTVLKTLATYSNRTTNNGYAQKTFDLSAYCGQTIQIYFTATETVDAQTFFAIDDVALNVQVNPVLLEAENLPHTSIGAATKNTFETAASGGEWVSLLSDSVDDSVDYTLTNVPSGTYDFNFVYKAHPNRGMMSMSLDGNLSDDILDQYSPVPVFQAEADYGLVTFNTSGNHTVHMVVTGKNAASTNYNISADAFALVPHTPPTDVEAETLTWTNSGASTAIVGETNASGGQWVQFLADGIGDTIDFTVPNVAAGVYRLKLLYKAHPNRGILSVSVNGSPLEGTLDQYAPSPAFQVEVDYGLVAFGKTGNQVIRLSVVGKNPASQGYPLSIDAFTLEPQ